MSSPMRTRRTSTATTGRFAHSGTPATRRFSRSGTTNRRAAAASRRHDQRRGIAGGWLERSQTQKQSGIQRAMSGVTGALPSLGKKRSSSSSSRMGKGGKAGGLALLAGAVGLAVKNRDKVASMARRDDGAEDRPDRAATTPRTPAATGPASTGTAPAEGNASDGPKL